VYQGYTWICIGSTVLKELIQIHIQYPSPRVSDPHPYHADPDPDSGFEINAYPDPGLDFSPKLVFSRLRRKRTLNPDQNADPDPDPGTPKMQIQCGSRI